MSAPLISVVITAFNSAAFIARAVASAFAQTWPALQVIVVDDGSTDDTAAVAAAAGAEVVVQENRGAPGARNRGLQVARGEFIAFLDADDVWLPARLERQMALLLADPALGLVTCHLRAQPAGAGQWPAGLNRAYYESDPPAWLPSGWLVRRAVFDVVGEFDPAFRASDDADWLVRLRDHRIATAVVPEVLVYKTIRLGSVSGDVADTQQRLLQSLRRSLQRRRDE